ncbi:MAG: hypothetical protein ACRDNL_05640, partial [Spirillospora sp.]
MGAFTVLRLHLTSADLAGLRVLPTFGPLAETVHSLGVLQGLGRPVLFDGWRRRAAARLTPAAASIAPFLFSPANRTPVDVISLTEPAEELGQSLEELASV